MTVDRNAGKKSGVEKHTACGWNGMKAEICALKPTGWRSRAMASDNTSVRKVSFINGKVSHG
jgi:hypothetical protein